MIAVTGISLLFILSSCQGQAEPNNHVSTTPQNSIQLEKKGEPKQDFYPESQTEQVSGEVPVNHTGQTDSKPDGSGVLTVSNPKEIEVVVNKQRKLPGEYVPDDLVVPDVPFSFDGWNEKKQLRKPAARALEQLFQAAGEENIELVAVSGYRSYQRQKIIYNYNVEVNGREQADQFSARPGHSEHQTGLAMDVSSASVSFSLIQDFGETAEGQWLAEHAHEFGFIIRYPEGKSHITGYAYEPWHLRYVGKEMAEEIYNKQLTLEEFFGLAPEQESGTNEMNGE